MTTFADPEAAERACVRLQQATGLDLREWVARSFSDNPAPDLALTNLERWLQSTSSPRAHLETLLAVPVLGRWLAFVLGASQPLADALIQNPDLAALFLDPAELGRIPDRASLEDEGRRLLAAATSHSHALDRLRFLRQRWMLPIVLNDLSGNWEPPTVWRAISDLADALVTLAAEAVWSDLARNRGLEGDCPVVVVAFGKLGGHELNYSSDVDLAFVTRDGLGEAEERNALRFAESLNRALSDRMGRGSLFRVDLRLRPYGGAGPLVASMRSVAAYYELYAEAWERQALVRARAVCGPPEIQERWEAMRTHVAFRPILSEVAVEEILSMRTRIEEHSTADDLKRGPGGIRDVEFLAQMLQLAHGARFPVLQARPTLDVLGSLRDLALLDAPSAEVLKDGYVFLRQLEHRCQLSGDQQTHRLPLDEAAKLRVAKSMGFGTTAALEASITLHRRAIQQLYESTLRPGGARARTTLESALGPYAGAARAWFEGLPEADAFLASLEENEGSLERVRTILADAPVLVERFRGSVALTEALLSGEIEEPSSGSSRIRELPADAPLAKVAEVVSHAWTRMVTRWVLGEEFDLSTDLAALHDALVHHCMRRLYADFDVLGLGSYATGQMVPGSDLDLLFLVPKAEDQPSAEGLAQGMLGMLGQLSRFGAPVGVDLRLRPDGRKGLLVRSYDGLRSYDLDGMEMWERFVLGQARLVAGRTASADLVRRIAYAEPLTPPKLSELLGIKHRIETERVKPQHLRRHVKLGHGGLNDIEWLVRLHEMRYPAATGEGLVVSMRERMARMGQAGLLNALETERLANAHRWLLEVRTRISLLGLAKDTVPENPDKLEQLARGFGDHDPNSFLARHEQVLDEVRGLYAEGIERLKA